MLEKILEFIRVPLYIIFLIFVILNLLLFVPGFWAEKLQLYDFIEKYRMYFGITFLFSGGILVANIILLVINRIKSFLLPKPSDKKIYINTINELSNILLLSNWDTFISQTTNGFVKEIFIDNRRLFTKLISTTIWPRKYCLVRRKIYSLEKRYIRFVDMFLPHATRGGGFYKDNKFYDDNDQDQNTDSNSREYKQWKMQCIQAFADYVKTLNALIALSYKYFSDEASFPETFKAKKAMN